MTIRPIFRPRVRTRERSPAAVGSASCVVGARLSSASDVSCGGRWRALGFLLFRLVTFGGGLLAAGDGGGVVEANEPSSGCGAGTVPATEAAMGRVVGWSVACTRFGCWPSAAISWVPEWRPAAALATAAGWGELATGVVGGVDGSGVRAGGWAAGGALARLVVWDAPGFK